FELERFDETCLLSVRRAPVVLAIDAGAPVVEIADIFGQDPLQMALIEDEHVIQAVASHGPDPALGYGIGSRRSEWCANLGNTNIAHPTMECGAVTAVSIMNEKSWLVSIPRRA